MLTPESAIPTPFYTVRYRGDAMAIFTSGKDALSHASGRHDTRGWAIDVRVGEREWRCWKGES